MKPNTRHSLRHSSRMPPCAVKLKNCSRRNQKKGSVRLKRRTIVPKACLNQPANRYTNRWERLISTALAKSLQLKSLLLLKRKRLQKQRLLPSAQSPKRKSRHRSLLLQSQNLRWKNLLKPLRKRLQKSLLQRKRATKASLL